MTASLHDESNRPVLPRRSALAAILSARAMLPAWLLIAPCLFFLLITFALPIGAMLLRSIEDPDLGETLPQSAAAFRAWPGIGLPPEDLVRVFVADVAAAQAKGTLPRAAKRLNFEIPGYRGLLLQTGRALTETPTGAGLAHLATLDARWADPAYWRAIKQASPNYTPRYFLAAFDLEFAAEGGVAQVPPDRRLYLRLLGRTIAVGAIVTGLCLLLGYPLAFFLASAAPRHRNLLLLLLLLPFWTSLLVRTTAWLVLLQNEGIVNALLTGLGLFETPQQLIRNRLGVYIAMTHILLPFMVLPIFSAMKGIPPVLMRAAYSLGAGPIRGFLRVYLPQSLPGVAAGALLVFIMSLGYYITPALVGGPGDQLLSYFIAENASATLNWGMAAALSMVLMLCVGLACLLFARLVGVAGLGMR